MPSVLNVVKCPSLHDSKAVKGIQELLVIFKELLVPMLDAWQELELQHLLEAKFTMPFLGGSTKALSFPQHFT